MEEKPGNQKSNIVFHVVEGSAFGTDMLGEKLDDRILEWLKNLLKVEINVH